MTAVGIERIGAYFGTAYVEVAELFDHRGLDARRLGNLMMRRKSVALPCEDVVTYAVNAAREALAGLPAAEISRIETVVVATESGVDFARSAAAAAHEWLALPRSCRLFEVKQACHGGVAALQVVAATLAADLSRDARALVIAGDVPLPSRGGYAEPSQGAGAVAFLIGRPALATWHPGRHGSFSFSNPDFSRPDALIDLIDVDLSILSYVDSLLGAFEDYQAHLPADFVDSFAALAMHTPFAGMVRGAHRTAMRKLTDRTAPEIDGDFRSRVAASLIIPCEVGNIYSACTLLAAASALRHQVTDHDYELGLFSYGGGSSAEFIGLTAAGTARADLAGGSLDAALATRARISPDRYDEVLLDAATTVAGVRSASGRTDNYADLIKASTAAGPRLFLESIDDYRRRYRWIGDSDAG
jgi:polyketide biosynthesis 3-hydroxy-3-methylglutaryl-CoA synthase-like enzyme PksG